MLDNKVDQTVKYAACVISLSQGFDNHIWGIIAKYCVYIC